MTTIHFNGPVCRRGHGDSGRYTSGGCVQCVLDRSAKAYEDNKAVFHDRVRRSRERDRTLAESDPVFAALRLARSSWLGARRRCNNPNNPAYKNYGGRGIRVCERWDTFEAFIADMGLPPPGATLDRIEVNGNYEPGNCRWIPLAAQADNRRNTVRLTLNGRTQTMKEWSRETGINYGTLKYRIAHRWPVERALSP